MRSGGRDSLCCLLCGNCWWFAVVVCCSCVAILALLPRPQSLLHPCIMKPMGICGRNASKRLGAGADRVNALRARGEGGRRRGEGGAKERGRRGEQTEMI